jgi:hypothetical protein
MRCHRHRIHGARGAIDTKCTVHHCMRRTSKSENQMQNRFALQTIKNAIDGRFVRPWQPFEENIYQNHLYTRIILPHHCKNICI